MKIKNIIGSLVLLSSISFANDYFVEFNSGYYDGKAESTSNSADEQTIVSGLELGMREKGYDLYFSYDYISWDDAKAQNLIFNVDFIIPYKSLDYFVGLGIGTMKYEVDDIVGDETKGVASIKAGINYTLDNSLYLSTGLRYLITNDIEVRDENDIYSSLDNMFGLSVGVGLRF